MAENRSPIVEYNDYHLDNYINPDTNVNNSCSIPHINYQYNNNTTEDSYDTTKNYDYVSYNKGKSDYTHTLGDNQAFESINNSYQSICPKEKIPAYRKSYPINIVRNEIQANNFNNGNLNNTSLNSNNMNANLDKLLENLRSHSLELDSKNIEVVRLKEENINLFETVTELETKCVNLKSENQ